eukprot:c37224_g1_i1 orf=106-288(+)
MYHAHISLQLISLCLHIACNLQTSSYLHLQGISSSALSVSIRAFTCAEIRATGILSEHNA